MVSSSEFLTRLTALGRHGLAEHLQDRLQQRMRQPNGNLPRWQQALRDFPALAAPVEYHLTGPVVKVAGHKAWDDAQRRQAVASLRALMPWRKGPFELNGVFIDSEWRSDWKWDRLSRWLPDLVGKRVLDVGAGNGYYCWRLLGEGADLVLGIDPSWQFCLQFAFFAQWRPQEHIALLPLGIDDMPTELELFDLVLSMGVLYHRMDPLGHLRHLVQCLKPGGTLVVETLVYPLQQEMALVPKDRYAKMRNVWFVPAPDVLLGWLHRLGLQQPRMVDMTVTSTREQRRTEWMDFQSLADFLDPEDAGKTVEGYPAPVRAIFLAERP